MGQSASRHKSRDTSSLLIGRRFVDVERKKNEGAQIARQIQFMLCFRGKCLTFDEEFQTVPLFVEKI